MVVPYLGSAAMRHHHQHSQSQLAPSPEPAVSAVQTAFSSPSSQQAQFIGLLQQAERRHRETLQRAVNAENQVHQLRQVFQQWQLQLQEQLLQRQQQVQTQLHGIKAEAQQQSNQVQHNLQLIQQQHAHQQVQLQRQVQKQMQALHDAMRRQQRTQEQENLRVREQLKDMYTFQQLQSYSYQQHLGQLQGQMFSLERNQRAERRNRQILQRQMQQTRRWQQQEVPLPGPAPQTARPCPDDNCCPCDFPEQCPFNPCFPEDCGVEAVPEGLDGGDCLLRNIRLGLIETPCSQCNSRCLCPSLKENRKQKRFEESEDGYLADDEASFYSDASSGQSSSFKEERRQILQEVRGLENTRLAPRYKEFWKPLRCFRCGELGHLATFCENMPTTDL